MVEENCYGGLHVARAVDPCSAVYKVQTIPHGRKCFRGLLLSCPVRGLTSLLDIQERTVLYSVNVGSKQQRKLSHTFCLACVYLLTKVHRKLWQIDSECSPCCCVTFIRHLVNLFALDPPLLLTLSLAGQTLTLSSP